MSDIDLIREHILKGGRVSLFTMAESKFSNGKVKRFVGIGRLDGISNDGKSIFLLYCDPTHSMYHRMEVSMETLRCEKYPCRGVYQAQIDRVTHYV